MVSVYFLLIFCICFEICPELQQITLQTVCQSSLLLFFCSSSILVVSPGPSDLWMFPLTDSSYDSLENELDNSSGGSPGFCSRRQLRPKQLQGSLDSILTFSDYDHDQDTDPDMHQTQTDSLHGLRTRGRRQDPDLSCPDQDALPVDNSSLLDSLSLDGLRRQRRRSEPAIAYVAKFGLSASRSTEGLTGEDDDDDGEEEHSKKHSRLTVPRGRTRMGGGEHGVRSAALEASSSSLSSTPISPAPTCSPLDSPDSLSGDKTWATRRMLDPTKTPLPNSSSSSSIPSSTTPLTISSNLTSSRQPDLGTCPKASPPKEPINWGTLKGCRGLHPNSWLKKGRRLSLTQQDNLEKEEEDKDKSGVSQIIRSINATVDVSHLNEL